MKTSLVLAALAAGVFATPAFAQDAQSTYVQVNLGAIIAGDVDLDVTMPPDTFNGSADLEPGLFGSVAAGIGMGNNFSVEGELMYFGSDIDTGEVDAVLGPLDASTKTFGAVINGIYTHDAGSFSPYIGAGVGYGTVEYDLAGESEDDAGLVWQVKAGITVPAMSDAVTLDFGYRYLSTPSFEISDGGVSVEAETAAHVLTVGARFAF